MPDPVYPPNFNAGMPTSAWYALDIEPRVVFFTHWEAIVRRLQRNAMRLLLDPYESALTPGLRREPGRLMLDGRFGPSTADALAELMRRSGYAYAVGNVQQEMAERRLNQVIFDAIYFGTFVEQVGTKENPRLLASVTRQQVYTAMSRATRPAFDGSSTRLMATRANEDLLGWAPADSLPQLLSWEQALRYPRPLENPLAPVANLVPAMQFRWMQIDPLVAMGTRVPASTEVAQNQYSSQGSEVKPSVQFNNFTSVVESQSKQTAPRMVTQPAQKQGVATSQQSAQGGGGFSLSNLQLPASLSGGGATGNVTSMTRNPWDVDPNNPLRGIPSNPTLEAFDPNAYGRFDPNAAVQQSPAQTAPWPQLTPFQAPPRQTGMSDATLAILGVATGVVVVGGGYAVYKYVQKRKGA